MDTLLRLDILPQPDDFTCGPTCLHAVYRYYGDDLPLDQVIAEVPYLEEGGTLAVLLGCHALRRGYQATIYTYNLQVFDPSWFAEGMGIDIRDKLRRQLEFKSHMTKLAAATPAYIEFLDRGGRLRLQDLNTALIRKYLNRQVPILTGLSATYLYRCEREWGPNSDYCDLRGEPTGHFVVLCGYDKDERRVLLADPHSPNPMSPEQLYEVDIDRAICSILLGIVTYDANLLIIEPPRGSKGKL